MDNPQETGTEARILQAAEEIFMRDGYDGARMQAIAEEAGINKALLHYYFRSKENLFEKVLVNLMSGFLPQATAAVTSQEADVLRRIEAFVDAYLQKLTKNPRLPLFILFSINRHPDFVKYIPRTLHEVVTTYFQQEIDAGRLKPVRPNHLLISIISMCLFPFISRPMAMHMMDKNDAEYQEFLSQRKEEIMKLISSIILP